MLALLLLLQSPSPDIIVTGQRLVEVQAECAKGGCTPLRDAQATIALAEDRFRNGNYLAAKRLLAKAIGRNKNAAAIAPRPVAALYEAMATVSLHEGDQDNYRRSVAHQVEILRENLPSDDNAVVSATTALGDMWIELRNFRQAEITYRGIEREALANGRDMAAMLAGIKRVWLTAAMQKPRDAEKMLNDLESRPIADRPSVATALRVLRLRFAAQGADEDKITKLVNEIARQQGDEPMLIYAPAYGSSNAAATANQNARALGMPDPVSAGASDIGAIQWIDVGFWIRPNGLTAEVEVLRATGRPGWAPAILNQVAGRRYTAKAHAEADDVGVYRIERVTRRTKYVTPAGSLVRRRVVDSGFDVLDLTDPAAKAPPKG
jgi:tetratricopeptide (TPR) repeat protein